jgi:lysophospholipase L1-like esterase
MQHLALIGDSILDNSPYTTPEPDTTTCLQRALGAGWTVALLARDGATMGDLRVQVSRLPQHAPTAVLSIGGNDAIRHVDILDQPAMGSAAVLVQLVEIAEGFGHTYGQVLADLRPRVQRLIVCTIYEPPFRDPLTARLAKVPLSLLNDQIVRAAAKAGADVLDLRTVCTEPTDFVEEIEPSPIGARKIAAAIEAVLRGVVPRPSVGLFAV